jgi:membrane protein
VASSYGAAGSFVVVLMWVYYSSQILLFGAALGREWDARQRRVVAAAHAAHAHAGAAPASTSPHQAPRRLQGQPGTQPRVASPQGQRARRH